MLTGFVSGLTACCRTIGLDSAAPGYCCSKNVASYIGTRLHTAKGNDRLYFRLLRRDPMKTDKYVQTLPSSVCPYLYYRPAEAISEVKTPIGNIYPIDLAIIRLLVSRGGWYSSPSQCLVFVRGSSTQIALRTLLMIVRCHIQRPLCARTPLHFLLFFLPFRHF